MQTSARVLADSISPHDHRLITVEVTMPRYLLSEFNTHRLFSRNSASSRAIPPEKQLTSLLDDPFIPVEFYSRAKGMGQDQALEGAKRDQAEGEWLVARTEAVRQALCLITHPDTVRWAEREEGSELGLRRTIDMIADAIRDDAVPVDWLNVSKSTVNRILETFKWHTVIVTGTEWENFFALRCPPGYEVDISFPAEPEIQRVALAMREAMRASTPVDLSPGEYHLPLVLDSERHPSTDDEWEQLALVSAGRCARVSFDTHENFEEPQVSYDRAVKLADAGHLSPFEHTATPFSEAEWQARTAMGEHAEDAFQRALINETTRDQLVEATDFSGNFRGWTQYRKLVPYEANRRGFIEEREPWDHAGLPEHRPVMGGDV